MNQHFVLTLEREVRNKEEEKKMLLDQEETIRRGKLTDSLNDVAWQQLIMTIQGPRKALRDRATAHASLAKQLGTAIKVQSITRGFLARKGFYNPKLGRRPNRAIVRNAAVWRKVSSRDGTVYYYNTVTGHTAWTKPPEAIEAPRSPEHRRLENVKAALEDTSRSNSALKRQIAAMEAQIRAASPPSKSTPAVAAVDRDSTASASSSSMKQPVRPAANTLKATPADKAYLRAADVSGSHRALKAFSSTGSAAIRKALLRALMVYEMPAGFGWYYIDGSQVRHGPYPDAMMVQWAAAGYFHPRQRMSRSPAGPFVAVSDIFGSNLTFDLRPRGELTAARAETFRFLNDKL